MTASLDQLMEEASTSLAKMDYLRCEKQCLEALADARRHGNWDYYSRILLPLQEARRRQRRMTASEGTIQLGTSTNDDVSWQTQPAGCVVVTHPFTKTQAHSLAEKSGTDHRFVEVLFADNRAEESRWTLRSFRGPAVTCAVPAPPLEWLNHSLPFRSVPPTAQGKTPADWFIDATEMLGDAALNQLAAGRTGLAELEAIESCLQVVSDHEIIHQRLATAARKLSLAERKSA